MASRDEAGGLGELDSLGAAPRAELIEQAAGMGLHGVFADEEPVCDFTIAEAGGDQAEDLEFARGNAELTNPRFVDDEGAARHGNFFDDRFPDDLLLNNDLRFLSGESESKPDAESGKEGGDQSTVNFDGMFDDQEAVFGEVEDDDEQGAANAVEEDVAQSAPAGTGVFGGGGH